MEILLIIGAVFLVLLNIYVSVFCFRREDLDTFQKCAQSILIWMVPFIGATLVYSINTSSDSSGNSLNGSDAPTGEHSSAATGNSSSSFGGDGGSD